MSSWGNSWGFSWGNSWGFVTPSNPLKIFLYGKVLDETEINGMAPTISELQGDSGAQRTLKGKAIQ